MTEGNPVHQGSMLPGSLRDTLRSAEVSHELLQLPTSAMVGCEESAMLTGRNPSTSIYDTRVESLLAALKGFGTLHMVRFGSAPL